MIRRGSEENLIIFKYQIIYADIIQNIYLLKVGELCSQEDLHKITIRHLTF